MSLNVKLAMLICLGFTSGMCWLVQQAARPIVELPSPVEPVADVADLHPTPPAPEPRELARRFEQASPVVVAAARRERLHRGGQQPLTPGRGAAARADRADRVPAAPARLASQSGRRGSVGGQDAAAGRPDGGRCDARGQE